MKESQRVKSEFEKVSNRLDIIEQRYEHIEEIGTSELRSIIELLPDLKNKIDLFFRTITTPETSLDIFPEISEEWSNLSKRIAEDLDKANKVRGPRLDLAFAIFKEKRNYERLKKESQRLLEDAKSRLSAHNSRLIYTSDPLDRDFFEDVVRDDERTVLRWEDRIKDYDNKIKELEADLVTLVEGGVFNPNVDIKEDEIVEEINNTKVEEKEVKKEQPKKGPRLTFADAEPKKKTPKFTFAEPEEVTEEEKITNRFIPIDDEENTLTNPLNDLNTKEEVVRKEKPKKLSEVVEEEEEKEEENIEPSFIPTEVEPEENTEVEKEVEVEEEENEEEYDHVGEMEMEETPVDCKVKDAKPALWKKVAKLVGKAIIYLSIVATAIHTGLSAKTNKANVTRADKEEVIEEETEIETDTSNKEEEKKEEETHVAEETKTPTKQEVKEEPKAELKPTNTTVVTPEQPKEEELKVELKQGESVYNEKTGVTVDYTGKANVETEKGLEEQKTRDLEHTSKETTVVTEKDLNKDVETKTTVVETTNERTGKEVTEEEFKQDKTEGEKANIDLAEEEAFMKFLEDNGVSRGH